MIKLDTILVFGIVCLLVAGCVVMVYGNLINEEEDLNLEEEIYQGPVPQGYDLEHFRKTGETIKEDNS